MSDPTQALVEAQRLLDEGDSQAAFAAIRPRISWPSAFESGSDWSETWTLFGQIAQLIIGVSLSDVVNEAAANPSDAHALYALGYELVEVGLPAAAATALMRADEIAPNNEPVIAELVHALETSGFNAAAVDVLQANPDMVAESFVLRYLLAFNAVMCADLELTREAFALLEPTDDDERFMYDRIDVFLKRAKGVERVSTLADSDLRGWHFVANGAILLHLSPYGIEGPMHGRYAFVQDSESLCREAVNRVSEVLDVWSKPAKTVYYLDDKGSHVLALALGKVLGVDPKPWPTEGTREPCLIVAYELTLASADELDALFWRLPEQILWNHAASWTEVPPFAADLHTFEHQHNVAPWGARLHFEVDEQDAQLGAPNEESPEIWAERILAAEPSAESLDDLDELRALARVAAELPESSRPTGLLLSEGKRPRFWDCSPVKSNRFQ